MVLFAINVTVRAELQRRSVATGELKLVWLKFRGGGIRGNNARKSAGASRLAG